MTLSAVRSDAPAQAPDCDVAAFMFTDQGAQLAREVGQSLDPGTHKLNGGGLSAAARISMGAPVARTILAEMGQMTTEDACESVAEIVQNGSSVVVIGTRDDLNLYRALCAAGARDYFAFPAEASDVLSAVARPVSPAPAAAPTIELVPTARPGTRIGVVGCAGGVGASMLAQNIAFCFSDPKGVGKRTALLDADLRFGTQAVDLDRRDTPGLLDALSAPDRIDDTLLGATMEKVNNTLSLYSHQPKLTALDLNQTDAMPQMIAALARAFDTVVVDVPRSALADDPTLAEGYDVIIPVLSPGYASVNTATRLLALLRDAAPSTRLLPVLSEFRQDAGLPAKDIAKAIGRDISAVLPKCDAAVRRAQRGARPLISDQPRSPYARILRKLCDEITAEGDSAVPKSIKSRLFGKVFA